MFCRVELCVNCSQSSLHRTFSSSRPNSLSPAGVINLYIRIACAEASWFVSPFPPPHPHAHSLKTQQLEMWIFFSFNSPTLCNYIHIRNQSSLVITISDMLINQTLVMLMN